MACPSRLVVEGTRASSSTFSFQFLQTGAWRGLQLGFSQRQSQGDGKETRWKEPADQECSPRTVSQEQICSGGYRGALAGTAPARGRAEVNGSGVR